MATDSIRKTPASQKLKKRPKVRKDFPLWSKSDGRWCKKLGGKFYYFGRWDDGSDPSEAEAWWDRDKSYLKQGLTPPLTPLEGRDGLSLGQLFDEFLTDCDERVDSGDLKKCTMDDYQSVCQRMADIVGKHKLADELLPADFGRVRTTVAKTCGPVGLSSFITRARVPFAWALENELIDRQVRYGSKFKKPSSAILLKNRNQQAEKFFEPKELKALIDGASQPLKSMILLAANCAFGNSDIGNLPLSALDLDAGVVEFPRVKTGVYRRCPLWTETIQSLHEWLEQRPKAKLREDNELVFITKYGGRWATETNDNPVSKEFSKLAKSLKLNKKFRGFYSIRHTHRTIADGAIDTAAVGIIMGHKLPGMSDVYVRRNRIGDGRLKAVTDHVRAWLWPENSEAPDGSPAV